MDAPKLPKISFELISSPQCYSVMEIVLDDVATRNCYYYLYSDIYISSFNFVTYHIKNYSDKIDEIDVQSYYNNII